MRAILNLTNLIITPEILKLIAEIDEFKGSWQVLNNQSPERLKNLRRVATIESIGSSTRIEGVKLTNAEIEPLLSSSDKQSLLSRDEQEVSGYAEAIETVFDSYASMPLTENYIKQLHNILLRHSEKDHRHRGEYKKHSNNVEAFDDKGKSLGVVIETASPFDTPRKMVELIAWSRDTIDDNSYHPLLVIAIFNVVFLAIHPFQDGNGRLSRIIVTWLLLRSGYTYIPYTSLESIIERSKEAYYLALRRTQTTLSQQDIDWLPWVNFFMRSLKKQKDHLIEKTSSLEQYLYLPKESALIMQFLDAHHRITIAEAEKLPIQTSRATLKKRFSELIEKGLIMRHGKARNTWYEKTKFEFASAMDNADEIINRDRDVLKVLSKK